MRAIHAERSVPSLASAALSLPLLAALLTAAFSPAASGTPQVGGGGGLPLDKLEIQDGRFPKTLYFWNHVNDMFATAGCPAEAAANLSLYDGANLLGDPYSYDPEGNSPLDERYDAFFALRDAQAPTPAKDDFLWYHGNGNGRKPDDGITTSLFGPEHWAYLIGGTLGGDITPFTLQVPLSVDLSLFAECPNPPNTVEDVFFVDDVVVIYERVGGVPDWDSAEFVVMTDAIGSDLQGNLIMPCDRGQFGTTAKSFSAGAHIAPIARTESGLWEFNWSTENPLGGRRPVGEILEQELVALTEFDGPPFTWDPVYTLVGSAIGNLSMMHAIEFDVMPFEKNTSRDGRHYDLNNDGYPDAGIFPIDDALVNTVAVGVTEFLLALRTHDAFQPGVRALMADGQTGRGMRPFPALDGCELEGFPWAWDELPFRNWSTGLNQLEAWRSMGATYDLNQLNLKFEDDVLDRNGNCPVVLGPGEGLPPRASRFRAAMGIATIFEFAIASNKPFASCLCDSTYDPVCSDVLDELVRGSDLQTNWLGRPQYPDGGGETPIIRLAIAGGLPDLIMDDGIQMDDQSFMDNWQQHEVNAEVTFNGGIMTIAPLAIPTPVVDVPCQPSQVLDIHTTEAVFRDSRVKAAEDLLVMFEVRADPISAHYPAGLARRLTISASTEGGGFSAKEVVAWMTDDWLQVEAFWQCTATPGAQVDITLRLDPVEGNAIVQVKNFRVFHDRPAYARQFEEGVVLVNPSAKPRDFDLSALFSGRQFEEIEGRLETNAPFPTTCWDGTCLLPPYVNYGEPVLSTYTLGGRDGIFLRDVTP